jgi:TatA/E family protein of Tat protein translocase
MPGISIGPAELVIVLLIALIVVGPGKLPDVGAALGKSIREFRKAAADVKESTSLEPSAPTAQAAASAPATATASAPAPVAPAPAAPAPEAPTAAAPVPSAPPAPGATELVAPAEPATTADEQPTPSA